VRILFLALDVDLCGKTGDSTHVRELAASFSTIGHEVSLVGYIRPESKNKVSDMFKTTNVSLHVPGGRGNLSTLRFGSLVAREFKPDVIYERRFSPKIGVTLGKMIGVPSVVEINSMIEEEKRILERDEGSAGLEKIKRRIRRYFLRSTSGIVAVSEGIRDGLIDEYDVVKSKVHVVHNGANTDLFRPMDKIESVDKLGLDQGFSYVCFSGNLAPWQGVESLISAFPTLIEGHPDLRLLLVGDGVLRNDLEKMVQDLGVRDHISFTGRVPYEDVPLYLNASEVCVAPFSGILRNIKYGFSAIKLYEYMGCGKPFVTTSVCGIEDEIEKNKIGIVVPPDEPEALAEAIANLLQEEEMAIEMGRRGRSLAEIEHSWNSVARRITTILEEVTQRTQR
jgi:glycosyltransferase involved in cell wall biosynthesis